MVIAVLTPPRLRSWRLAALAPFADPARSGDWHVWNLNGVEHITVEAYTP